MSYLNKNYYKIYNKPFLILVLDPLFSSTESTVNVEDKVYLEDLANAPSLPPPNSKIENLSLSISFEKTESKDLYEKGVKRLKESFPNVKSVDFNGGYLYDPTEDVSLLNRA